MLLERLTRALQRHLPTAVQGDSAGLHRARVATRRLREVVPVFTAGVKGVKTGKADRKIRRLTRTLGTVRELDVTLRILDELAGRPDVPRDAIDDVRAHVIAARDRRRDVMLERLERMDAGKLDRRLRTVAAALAVRHGEPWRDVLAARLRKRARRFHAALQSAGPIYAPDRLHEVRIAVKKLRYALEIAGAVGATAAQPPIKALKRAQGTLGRLHDLQVLQRHVADVAAGPPVRHGATPARLDTLSRALEAECRHLHAHYLAAVPALLDVAGACRTGVVPQLSTRRPLRMALQQTRGARKRRA